MLIPGLENAWKQPQASAQRAREPWTWGWGQSGVQSPLCNATPSRIVSGLGEGQARGWERRTCLPRVWMKLEALGQEQGPLGHINCPEDRAGQPSSGCKGAWVASQRAGGLTLAHGFPSTSPAHRAHFPPRLSISFCYGTSYLSPHQTSTHPHTPTRHHGS